MTKRPWWEGGRKKMEGLVKNVPWRENTIVKLLPEGVKIGVAEEITSDRLTPSEAGDRVRGQTMQDIINHGRDTAFS